MGTRIARRWAQTRRANPGTAGGAAAARRLRDVLAEPTALRQEEEERLDRAINLARWGSAGIVFAVGPIFPNVGLAAVLALGAALVAYGVAFAALHRRTGASRRWLPGAAFVADLLAVCAAMLIFSPDALWTTFVFGSLVVIVGAFRFGRSGSFGAALLLSAAYTGIAFHREAAYGLPAEPMRLITHVGFFFLTAVLMSAILRELNSLRARDIDFYQPLLKAQSDLGEIIVVNDGHRPIYWSDALAQVSRRTREELAGLTSVYDLLVEEERERVHLRVQTRLRDGLGDTFETVLLRSDGAHVPIEVALEPFRRSERDWIVVVARDITERKSAERELLRQAVHDPLTGLANRTLLADRLELAIAQARRSAGSVALLVMDLDDFKEINDTFGHESGDALLRQLGERMRGLRRESDTVARLGGDEFAVVLPGADAGAAEAVAAEIRRALEKSFVMGQQELEVGASIGISIYPDLAQDADLLMRQADVAMYVAKRERTGHAIYERGKDTTAPYQLTLAAELRAALERNEFVAYFQPLVAAGGRAVGMEALVRWIHPTKGLVPPVEFVRLAEQSGLIRPLFAQVLGQAVAECRSWHEAGWPLAVSVNLSPRNLQDPDLVRVVADALAGSGLEPSSLVLEITESSIIADPVRAHATLDRLRAVGVKLALDDFGTGYSSLSHVHDLPVQQLKIDRSFVKSLTAETRSAAMVRSTIELGHNFGLEVVAEGVEDEVTLAALAELGCDTVQGYYFSKPLPAAAIAGWLEAQPRPLVALEPTRAAPAKVRRVLA